LLRTRPNLIGAAWSVALILLGAACIDTADLGTIPDAASDLPNLTPDAPGGTRDGSSDGNPQPKDGDCNTNDDCKNVDEFCKKSVGECVSLGTCTPIPKSCPPGGSTVCDCNGNNQSSACEAELKGVSVASTMPCPAGPATCDARASDGPHSVDP
jgi:hypothetical protein